MSTWRELGTSRLDCDKILFADELAFKLCRLLLLNETESSLDFTLAICYSQFLLICCFSKALALRRPDPYL